MAPRRSPERTGAKRLTIDAIAQECQRYHRLGASALAQVDDASLHRIHGGDGGQSLATKVQHLRGNLRSRFTDFLEEDGENSWRHRDGEFIDAHRPRAEMMARWDAGWTALEGALTRLDEPISPARCWCVASASPSPMR